jgi:hypothetical protein
MPMYHDNPRYAEAAPVTKYTVSYTRNGTTITSRPQSRKALLARVAVLDQLEALRKEHAPTHWGVTDEWYAAERKAILALLSAK